MAENSGLIKVFDDFSDTTPTAFADLGTEVHNFWDRGMLGMVLELSFPDDPYVYVLYTHDDAIGGTAPRWDSPGKTSDPCPNPPGATASPTSGALPLTVDFDGSTSSDPGGGSLSYAWDLEGGGAYDDSTEVKPSYTYDTAGAWS